MTKFILYSNKEHFLGYEVEGHSTNDQNDQEGKLVCSAVSSAVIMTANTITDILSVKADVTVKDGYLKILVKSPDDKTDLLIEGLKLHINELKNEYKGRIKLITEDYNND